MKQKTRKVYLNAPEGVKVIRHNFPDGEIRFTTPAEGYESLVAIYRNEKFIWIREGFTS